MFQKLSSHLVYIKVKMPRIKGEFVFLRFMSGQGTDLVFSSSRMNHKYLLLSDSILE